MGLAGLRALSTVDSGMPTITAARPFRWGWRCLGEQRTNLSSKLHAFARKRRTAALARLFPARVTARASDALSKCEGNGESDGGRSQKI
jgi:hypothetical protein